MKNPLATIHLSGGGKIVIELLPESAPNTVNSFIWAAKNGIFDNHSIQRIVPEDWIDMSYTGFNKHEGQYLIPYEAKLHPEIEPLDSHFGCVCMGGYGELGQAGCEFFFPLRDCPTHKGVYPVFGKVIEGHSELERLRDLELVPVTDYPDPNLKVNRPVVPQIMEKVELELFGQEFPDPIVITDSKLPSCWTMIWD
ncbi:MAG: peptidylprolyl isomerase [Oscillospiraceae bacterium]|nr:peptidylprolyl isomerase [Oscillospiraceae bacterium]